MYLDTNFPIASVKYNNVEMELKSPSLLPKGYTQVAYIQSSGTQCLNTGFNPNSNTKVVIDAQHDDYTVASNYFFYFGCSDGTNTFALGDAATDNNLIRYYYGGTNYTNTWDVPVGNRRTIVVDKETATVDGVSKSYSPYSFSFNIPLCLFGSNNNGTFVYAASMKLFSCQIYDNGTLVRDFVPCINENKEAGLYDLVNGVFYGDAAGGLFGSSLANSPAPVLLWTNASPTSDFVVQTISVDGTDYDGYLIEIQWSRADSAHKGVAYVPIGTAKATVAAHNNGSGTLDTAAFRSVEAATKQSISFGIGATGPGRFENNYYAIPTRIWGVKFTL